jgi:hypothetical protein
MVRLARRDGRRLGQPVRPFDHGVGRDDHRRWGLRARYSIITAENLSAASEAAQACPVLVVGGSVEVYEATPIG